MNYTVREQLYGSKDTKKACFCRIYDFNARIAYSNAHNHIPNARMSRSGLARCSSLLVAVFFVFVSALYASCETVLKYSKLHSDWKLLSINIDYAKGFGSLRGSLQNSERRWWTFVCSPRWIECHRGKAIFGLVFESLRSGKERFSFFELKIDRISKKFAKKAGIL